MIGDRPHMSLKLAALGKLEAHQSSEARGRRVRASSSPIWRGLRLELMVRPIGEHMTRHRLMLTGLGPHQNDEPFRGQ